MDHRSQEVQHLLYTIEQEFQERVEDKQDKVAGMLDKLDKRDRVLPDQNIRKGDKQDILLSANTPRILCILCILHILHILSLDKNKSQTQY